MKAKDLDIDYKSLPPDKLKKEIKRLELDMKFEAENLNFERAAYLRDLVVSLKKAL